MMSLNDYIALLFGGRQTLLKHDADRLNALETLPLTSLVQQFVLGEEYLASFATYRSAMVIQNLGHLAIWTLRRSSNFQWESVEKHSCSRRKQALCLWHVRSYLAGEDESARVNMDMNFNAASGGSVRCKQKGNRFDYLDSVYRIASPIDPLFHLVMTE